MSEVTQEEWAETNRKMQELFQQVEAETLHKMPMWMKFNYLGNKIAKGLKDGYADKDFNWDKINEILNDRDEYDFNAFDRIETSDNFFDARARCIEASVINMVWQEHICKDCGQKFTMTFNKAQFFKNKELHIPKRCRECRETRKQR